MKKIIGRPLKAPLLYSFLPSNFPSQAPFFFLYDPTFSFTFRSMPTHRPPPSRFPPPPPLSPSCNEHGPSFPPKADFRGISKLSTSPFRICRSYFHTTRPFHSSTKLPAWFSPLLWYPVFPPIETIFGGFMVSPGSKLLFLPFLFQWLPRATSALTFFLLGYTPSSSSACSRLSLFRKRTRFLLPVFLCLTFPFCVT